MGKVSAAQVKELREKTGAGMLDCKNALVESDGNMEAAVDFLRKKGLSQAAKKAGRITSEGLVASYVSDDEQLGVILEVNCETDFVARNTDFQAYTQNMTKHIAKFAPKCIKDGDDALMDQNWIENESKKISEVTTDLLGVIGENISPRRFERWEVEGTGAIHTYIHMGGKLGVLVEVGGSEASVANDQFKNFIHLLSMHIAAASPLTLDRDSVDEATLNREKEIFKTQVLESGKPENLVDRIVEGKINKFYKQSCLIEQEWVHDTSLTVAKAMAALSKELGDEITIRRYNRMMLGEGLEKRSNDLAAEVAEQLEGK